MNRIILVKTCNELELAHVYEHLYLSALSALFKERKLLDYLDYRWHGETHHGGYIYIYVALVTPQAQKLAAELACLDLSFAWESVIDAVAEVEAESKKRIGGNNKVALQELKKLHAQPWQTIDEFTYFDSKNMRRSRKIFWDSDQDAHTKILKSEFILDNTFVEENRIQLPLFRSVVRTLEDNVTHDLVREFNYYRLEGESTVYNKSTTKEGVAYRVRAKRDDHLENELDIYKMSITWALEQNFISKLVLFMQNRRQQGKELIGPDEVDIYKACGIFMGDKGWRETATEANIREIMKYTTLQLTFGREKQVVELASLLENKK